MRNFDEIMKKLEEGKMYHQFFIELLEKVVVKRKKDGTHFKNVNQTFENGEVIFDNDCFHPIFCVSGRDKNGKWQKYEFPLYLFADTMEKDDVRLEKVVKHNSCVRDTYCFDTDEIIAEIARQIELRKGYIANYEKQIESAKGIFTEVEKKVNELFEFIKSQTYDLRNDERKFYPSSLEYALIDYVRDTIR